MQITWLGHGSFRVDMGGQVLLIDPWFTGNPMFPEERKSEALEGATHILLTHCHFDHVVDAMDLSRELGVPVVGQYDVMAHWEEAHGLTTVGFNKGGTVHLGDVAVTMVNAVHSSSFGTADGPRYGGTECGFMIEAGGRCLYVSGDTDVTSDMGLWQELHRPQVGILSAGGHFTMDMKRAAFAAKRFFDFEVVIPCHYRTFPILEQSAEVLAEGLPGVRVIEPEVMQAIAL